MTPVCFLASAILVAVLMVTFQLHFKDFIVSLDLPIQSYKVRDLKECIEMLEISMLSPLLNVHLLESSDSVVCHLSIPMFAVAPYP